MKTYTMSRQAIEMLIKMVSEHYDYRDGEYNKEAVYLIYGYQTGDDVLIEHYASCHNAHPDPLNYFGVDKEEARMMTDLVRAVRPGVDLVGCLHTHEAAGTSGPSWTDVNDARQGVINAVLCAYDRSVSFYDDRGFIVKFHLYQGRLVTNEREVLDSDTHIAQYPFPPADE